MSIYHDSIELVDSWSCARLHACHIERAEGSWIVKLENGMDNMRSHMGNPLPRIDPDEIIDTRPYKMILIDHIINNDKGNPSITKLWVLK